MGSVFIDMVFVAVFYSLFTKLQSRVQNSE
jgi:hypothetical protein